MKKTLVKGLLALSACAATLTATMPATASDWPLVMSDYWEVTGVHLKDGGAA